MVDQAGAPPVVLLTTWAFGAAKPNIGILFNIVIIGFGVALASLGEIHFSIIGFIFQLGGTLAEAIRLVMVQILLSGKESDAKTPEGRADYVGVQTEDIAEEDELEKGIVGDKVPHRGTVVQEQKFTGAAKMDPLVSLYYYAPVCAVTNLFVALVFEMPSFEVNRLASIGPLVLIANAAVVFLLNVSSVFLVCNFNFLVHQSPKRL